MPRLVTFVCGALLAATPVLAQTAPKFGTWGVDLTSLDKAVKPGDNFFLYINGGWLKTAEIPADRSSTGSFQDLQILSEERLKTIVADLKKKPDSGLSVEERKLRDLYDAFVDTQAIEAHGLAPVQKDLDYLAGLQTPDDVAHAMGSVKLSTMSIYNIGIGVDDKNPDNYSVNLSQAGLGMPDRDYYLSSDEAIVKTREAYRKYLADMMTLAGMSDAQARADKVLALETEIAKVSWNRADRRDADKIYNPMPASALKTLAPDFAWDAFLSEGAIPLKKPDGSERYVIVAEKTAFGPRLARGNLNKAAAFGPHADEAVQPAHRHPHGRRQHGNRLHGCRARFAYRALAGYPGPARRGCRRNLPQGAGGLSFDRRCRDHVPRGSSRGRHPGRCGRAGPAGMNIAVPSGTGMTRLR